MCVLVKVKTRVKIRPTEPKFGAIPDAKAEYFRWRPCADADSPTFLEPAYLTGRQVHAQSNIYYHYQ